MNSSWQKVKLLDLIKVKHGFAFKGKYIGLEKNHNIVLTPGNFKIGGGFKGDKFKYYSTDDFPKSYILKKNDLLITMTDLSKTGDTLGFPAKIPDSINNERYLHNQRLGLVEIIHDDIIHDDYLYWLLRTKQYQKFIVNSSTGSTVKHTSPSRILEYEFNLPPLPTQKKIAHILSTLDDKIELNRKMNQTLEEMAQALFKSWFVDFDPVHAKVNCSSDEELEAVAKELGISKEILELFPSEFEDSELGMIPKGWGVEKFGNIIDKYIDNRGKTPPIVDNGIPLLEVRNMPDDMLTSNPNVTKFVTEDTYNNWFRSYLEENDILISTVGTIGKTCIVPKKSKIAIAQNVLGLRFKSSMIKSQFMFYQMKHKRFLHAIDARLVITVQASIKRKDLNTIDVLIPSQQIQEAFVKQIQPIIEKQQSNENIELQKTRDTLLPKLLSGEIEV